MIGVFNMSGRLKKILKLLVIAQIENILFPHKQMAAKYAE